MEPGDKQQNQPRFLDHWITGIHQQLFTHWLLIVNPLLCNRYPLLHQIWLSTNPGWKALERRGLRYQHLFTSKNTWSWKFFRWKLDLHRWIRHLPPWSSLLLCSSCDKYLLATSNQPHYLLKARLSHISLQSYHHPAIQSFYMITCSMIMHDYDCDYDYERLWLWLWLCMITAKNIWGIISSWHIFTTLGRPWWNAA